jgi:hypothetical protein
MSKTIHFADFKITELVSKAPEKKEIINLRALDNAVAVWANLSEAQMDKREGDR